MFWRSNLAQVIRIFVSCAEEDKEFLHGLERQLSSLKREGLVKCYTRYGLSPGIEWREKARENLNTANIILLLVSPFFVASDYCYKEEATLAMALHNSGKTRVIPIIVRPIEWERLMFGGLASLPTGEAVSMWPNTEEAFSNIVKGIKETIGELRSTLRTTSKDRLLPFWNVPYWQNPFFTGREDVLADLQRAFASLQAPLQAQALSGLAGVGKTQVAVEYAYRHASSYRAILWVHADSPEILLSSFVDLSEVLDLPERNEANQPSIVRAVKRWLQQNTQWLLVVDNLEDIDLLRDLVPSPHSGHILVTTRSHRTGQIARRIYLEPMQIDDGALLLLRRAKLLAPGAPLNDASEADNAVAKKIAEAVHGLPLALDQAGAYIEETERSLSDYVDLYQQYSSSLLKRRGASGHDHPAPVTTTFSLSFEKVKALNPTAIELLEFCAFLHPDAIPEEMIIGGASALPPLLRTAATDPIKFDRAIEDLLKFSFVRRKSDQNILIVHRLVQAVVKEAMSEERQREYMEQVVRVINTVFPSPEFPNWSRCQRYLLQAQTAGKLIQQGNVLLPEASQLLYRVGGYLYQRGLYDEAEGLLTRASVMAEVLLGGDHPTLIPILNMLGKVYFLQGRYSQVEPLLLRSLALGERLLGMEDPELGESLNTLGRTYHKQGRYSEAEPLLQRALALRKKVLGQEHPKVAISMNSLATLYNRQGKYEEAEAFYIQALTILQAILDPQHPDIADNLNNLAVFYGRRGKYEQAEPLAKQAVKMYEQTLGPEHPRVINGLDTLAEIHQEQGKYSEAEPSYQRIFIVAHKQLGPEHPELVTYGNHLARLYFLQGKYVEAEATARQAFTLGERVLGHYHYRVGTTINTLADTCKVQEKYVEAEELYVQALEIREKVLAPNDINRAITLESYADLLQLTGRQAEAEKLRNRADLIRREQLTN
jgi:tetratricopeptide (TPR) repeat protein